MKFSRCKEPGQHIPASHKPSTSPVNFSFFAASFSACQASSVEKRQQNEERGSQRKIDCQQLNRDPNIGDFWGKQTWYRFGAMTSDVLEHFPSDLFFILGHTLQMCRNNSQYQIATKLTSWDASGVNCRSPPCNHLKFCRHWIGWTRKAKHPDYPNQFVKGSTAPKHYEFNLTITACSFWTELQRAENADLLKF